MLGGGMKDSQAAEQDSAWEQRLGLGSQKHLCCRGHAAPAASGKLPRSGEKRRLGLVPGGGGLHHGMEGCSYGVQRKSLWKQEMLLAGSPSEPCNSCLGML